MGPFFYAALYLLCGIVYVEGNRFGMQKISLGVIADKNAIAAEEPFLKAMDFVIERQANKSYQHRKVAFEANTKTVAVNNSFQFMSAMCGHMESGVQTLFGHTLPISIDTMRSLARKFHMPFISLGDPLIASHPNSKIGYPYELYIRPYYANAFVDLIKNYKYSIVYYFHDSPLDGTVKAQQIIDSLSEQMHYVNFEIFYVSDAKEAHGNLLKIENEDDTKKEKRVVILDAEKDLLNDLLKILKIDRIRLKFNFIIARLGIVELNWNENFPNGGLNITGFELLRTSSYEATWSGDYLANLLEVNKTINQYLSYRGLKPNVENYHDYFTHEIALTLDAMTVMENVWEKLLKFDDNDLQSLKRSVHIDCNKPAYYWDFGRKLIDELRKVEIKQGLTGTIAFDEKGFRKNFVLSIFQVTNTKHLKQIGFWSPKEPAKREGGRQVGGFRKQEIDMAHRKYYDIAVKGKLPLLSNKTRIVTSILTGPYLMLKEDHHKYTGNDRYEGFCADLAQKVAEIVQFDYEIVPVKDGKYGSALDNDTWNGMIGELIRNTAPYLLERNFSDDGRPLYGNDRYDGYCADLAKLISKYAGFNYLIVPVKDGKYGSRGDNDSWNGMVGELIRNEADLAIAPLTITAIREEVVDFSKPFMSLGISIIIKKPSDKKIGVFSFMYPLSYEIWMCVIFAYIGVSVVLFLVSRFSPFEWHVEETNDGPIVTNNFTIFNSLWFSFSAFVQQACDVAPKSISGRIVGCVWWFFTLIVISSYTANLAAFLTVQRMNAPIESADDLAKQQEIKYGTVESGTTRQFFKDSTIPPYDRMWSFMNSQNPSVFVSSNEAGIKRVRKSNGRYAFLIESTTNDYINQRYPCDTMKVGQNLDSKGYGIATPLMSDLRDKITLAVLGMRENNVLDGLHKKWWYEKGDNCDKDQTKGGKDATNALQLSNVAGIFYICICGLVLAVLSSFMEFCYLAKVESSKRKTSFGETIRTRSKLSFRKSKSPIEDLPPPISADNSSQHKYRTYSFE